jgi:hypothetical protein
LLCFKIKYPENFFLLRGNHECANVTRGEFQNIFLGQYLHCTQYMGFMTSASEDVISRRGKPSSMSLIASRSPPSSRPRYFVSMAAFHHRSIPWMTSNVYSDQQTSQITDCSTTYFGPIHLTQHWTGKTTSGV